MKQKTIPNIAEDLFSQKQEEIGNFAKEIAERGVELMEFQLFVSSSGEKHLDKISNAVKELRKKEAKGEIDLKQYEDLEE